MQLRPSQSQRRHGEEGSILAYFVVLMILVTSLVSLGSYVSQTTRLTQRRLDMAVAREYAHGGAVASCAHFNNATTNLVVTLATALANNGYVKNNSLSTSKSNVYTRAITQPFTNQTVNVQIWTTNSASPMEGKILSYATVGGITQTSTVNVTMGWAYPAAIISTHPGTSSSGASKSTAQDGNVVVTGGTTSQTVVDGGILANGRVNIDNKAYVPPATVSQTNRNTINQIPDYTEQGTTNTLFDFARLIAIAKATTNSLNLWTGNNYFTNINTFIAANNAAFLTPAKALEGVIVVEIGNRDNGTGNLNPSKIPNGINVRGTLFFNFGSDYGPLDKVVNTAAINVNPANLTGLVATNPATFTTGYPPVYYDNSKNPTNINPVGHAKVTATEDLPAMVYSIGIFDVHGPANISGVCYTPSFFELENKNSNQIQYFKGTMISGLGILLDNGSSGAKSIISIDPNAIDSLATQGVAGKTMSVAYWE